MPVSKGPFAPTAVSLFSGAGGLDLGIELAGFDIRGAVEIEPAACRTLRENVFLSQASSREFESWWSSVVERDYKRWDGDRLDRTRLRVKAGLRSHDSFRHCEVLEVDIRELSSADLMAGTGMARGELTLVAGGPPCQSFSRSGQRGSVDDDRGQLFLEFVRIVRDLRPRWFLFENVRGLTTAKTNIWRSVCQRCGAELVPPFEPDRRQPLHGSSAGPCSTCGGKTTWKVEERKPSGALEIILSEFERTGYTCHPFILNAVEFGVPQFRERLFIVGSRDGEDFAPPRATHAELAGEALASDGIPMWKTTWDALFSTPNLDHPWPLDPEVAVLWVRNVVRPHDEPVTWSLHRPSPTVGAHQGAKLAIAPHGVPPEQLARQQWHVLGRRQRDSKPVEVDHQMLSDRDLLLLQTFPESWYVAGTRMERAFQIGNAVPPLLAERVSERLLGKGEAGILKPLPSAQAQSRRRDSRAPRAETVPLFEAAT